MSNINKNYEPNYNIDYLYGKQVLFSYPIVRLNDIIFKVGKNIVLLVDKDPIAERRSYTASYGKVAGTLLDATNFYVEDYIALIEFTKPLLCNVIVKNYYEFDDNKGYGSSDDDYDSDDENNDKFISRFMFKSIESNDVIFSVSQYKNKFKGDYYEITYAEKYENNKLKNKQGGNNEDNEEQFLENLL